MIVSCSDRAENSGRAQQKLSNAAKGQAVGSVLRHLTETDDWLIQDEQH